MTDTSSLPQNGTEQMIDAMIENDGDLPLAPFTKGRMMPNAYCFLRHAAHLHARLPVQYHAQILMENSGSVKLQIQAGKLEDVEAIRRVLGIRMLKKTHQVAVDWWDYDAEFEGVHVNIYAVREAPKTCRLVEREVTVQEYVPVEFEEKLTQVPVRRELKNVTKTIKEWVCDGDK